MNLVDQLKGTRKHATFFTRKLKFRKVHTLNTSGLRPKSVRAPVFLAPAEGRHPRASEFTFAGESHLHLNGAQYTGTRQRESAIHGLVPNAVTEIRISICWPLKTSWFGKFLWCYQVQSSPYQQQKSGFPLNPRISISIQIRVTDFTCQNMKGVYILHSLRGGSTGLCLLLQVQTPKGWKGNQI